MKTIVFNSNKISYCNIRFIFILFLISIFFSIYFLFLDLELGLVWYYITTITSYYHMII